MIENKKLIKDVVAVQRFRNILFYELRVLDGINLVIFFHFVGLLGVVINMIGISFEHLIKFVIGFAILLAIIFTPYIFYILIKENKYGWIILYFAMIIIPLLFVYLIFRDALLFEAIVLLPLGSFYIYCYLIKFEVDKWLSDYNWHQERMQRKKETEE
jgi:hypothetical protein